MRKKILAILKSSNDYVSGQELARQLNVSRTAVWKNIKTLQSEGCLIEAVNNKGYRLVSCPEVLDESGIRSHLTTKYIGNKIFCYDETDSTNTRAKHEGESGGENGSLFAANLQTAGKGRRGRSWVSQKGEIAAVSFLLRPEIEIECVSRITLVAAVAVARVLAKLEGLKPRIKWPNDVVVNGKKICGILTEMSSEGMDINYVVVGIGINDYNETFPDNIAYKATSIKLENGKGYDRAMLIADLANEFEQLFDEFVNRKDLSFLLEEYNSLLVNKDEKVYVISDDKKTEYTAIGLSPNGGLLVKNELGEIENIISGEVSVRGIYGYV